MALVSPGVEVTIIDESQYIPAATNSVPYVLLVTAQNKASAAGTGVAAGTLKVNAGKVYLITSQRDLAATFGTPFFYKTSAGTPINGYELNEYGLLAAHSVLGVSNRAYVQRADVDLAELTATLVRPVGQPNDGSYWLDTAATSWGIFQWNQTTGTFTPQTPIVITDSTQVSGSVPLTSVGSIGSYAVVAVNANNPVYYKNYNNTWVEVGTNDWKSSWPAVQAANSVAGSLTATNSLIINGTTVLVPASPATLLGLKNAINAALIPGVTAVIDGSDRLQLYADANATPDLNQYGGLINIDAGSTAGLLTTLGISAGDYYAPALQQSPNYTLPRWRATDTAPKPTGSVWCMTTAVNFGANIAVKRYSATVEDFIVQAAPIYANDWTADSALDPASGGRNIAAGSLYVQYNTVPEETTGSSGVYNNTYTYKIWQRAGTGALSVTGDTTTPTFTSGNQFSISASSPNSTTLSAPVVRAVNGTSAADFCAAVSSASVPYVSAAIADDGSIVVSHSQGGVIVLTDLGGGNAVAAAGFNSSVNNVKEGSGDLTGSLILSSWVLLDYVAGSVAPSLAPIDGRKWYYSATNRVDIMVNTGDAWIGYRNEDNDARGYDLTQTNATGPIFSATAPIEQSDATSLEYGDLWIDTSDLENYPKLYRWSQVQGVDQWVILDNSDQTTSNGILFADARWASNGTTNPITDPMPTIASLLTSNYLDLDAPDPTLYPAGTLLWNTRRSGFNVKSYQVDYFNANTFAVDYYSNATSYNVGDKVLYNGVIYVATNNGSGNLPTNAAYWSRLVTDSWVTASGNRNDGSPNMGRKAQREIIVQALKAAIDTQDTLREEQQVFNLLACPQYPELMPNMIRLNNERNNTGFVVGDTPLRLAATGTDLLAWATNSTGLTDGEAGLIAADQYCGVFYPSCQTTDLTGAQVVQPSSHMMLRTIVRSDEVAYPWLAPAGVRRGVIDNAERIGYINGLTGEFQTIATGQGLRDVLYENKINPITFIPGVGITNYGNKTLSPTTSAMDRINVARLVAYLRGRLQEIGKQFVFEPNDQITRNEITNAIDGLMIDLVAKRGIYDYLIVCDLSNNTPARIDRNELYVDIAIEPVKAVEFIYIPVRIKNTGEISGGTGPTTG